MNLASLVAELLDGQGFNGLLVRVVEYKTGECDAISAEQWDATLAQKHADGWRVVDLTGRKGGDPDDPQEVERRLAAANAATLEGRRAAMEAHAHEPAAPVERSLDCYRYADLMAERERCPAAAMTTPAGEILG